MEIREVDPATYDSLLPNPYVVFNSANFNRLVSPKIESVKYLIFTNPKPRFGIIVGFTDGKLISPFSAPYGGFSQIAETPRMVEFGEGADALCNYAEANNIRSIYISLPPTIYNETFISKQANALINAGFQLSAVDLNSSFDLADFDDNYLEKISYSAKKNYKTGLRNGLVFNRVSLNEEKELVYQIIKENRESKGRQVKMSFDEVMRTSEIIPVDFFLVSHQSEGVASAIVYQVNRKVAQVVYWGSRPQYDPLRPTNLLSYNLWEHYKNCQFDIVDIGPSSQSGKPDAGLLDFKETLGCKLSMKLSFYREFIL